MSDPQGNVQHVAHAATQVAEALAAGLEDDAFREVINMSDRLRGTSTEQFTEQVTDPPTLVGDVRYDALLAAVIDVHLSERNQERPAWLDDPDRKCAPPFDVEPVPELRAAVRAATPPACARHGVYLHPDELASG